MSRPLNKIAAEILADWGPKPSMTLKCYAMPYVEAMLDCEKITDFYGCDPADDIVIRFLFNASTWRGETAVRIKAELNAMIKEMSK